MMSIAKRNRRRSLEESKEKARQLAEQATSCWRWQRKRLTRAREELEGSLDVFCESLDDSSVFRRMPKRELEVDYLWLMFASWGEPRSDTWNFIEDSSLRGLPTDGFLVAFASLQAQIALWWLISSNVEDAEKIVQANRHISSGVEALRQAREHVPVIYLGKKKF